MARLLSVLALTAVLRLGIAGPVEPRQSSSQYTYVNLASNTGTSVHRASGIIVELRLLSLHNCS